MDMPTNPPQVSKLHVHSFGIVAADKSLSSNFVEVTPVEDFPMQSGSISSSVSQYQAQGTNAAGQTYSDSIQQTSTVRAEWMPMGSSNRKTSPDVRAGERVVLWRMGESDKYYWVTMMDDLTLRKLETVIYAWSATTSENQDTTADTSYFFEVSTHNKMMHLHTSKANGEIAMYDLQINGGSGVIQITDDLGNSLYFDSSNFIIQLQNGEGTTIQINKKNATWVVPETLAIQAKNGTFVFEESWNIHCPDTTHDGNFNEIGAFGLAGDFVTAVGTGGGLGSPGTGKIQIAGNAELLGSMDVKGNMTAVTIEATESITAPNLKYN